MKICFINPPFKTEYGRFSRESRSPCIGHSRILYYPLWLIYAAAVCEREGFDVDYIDACAWELNLVRTMARVREKSADARLFVLDTSTPSITSDVRFGAALKEKYPDAFVLLVGTHPSATVDETLAMSEKIDGIARREYDYIVRDLAKALRDNAPLSDERGLSFRL